MPETSATDTPGASGSDLDAQLVGLADSVRRLSQTLLVTEAPPDKLREAAAAVDQLNDLLDVQRPDQEAQRGDSPRHIRMFNPIEGAANPAAPPVATSVVRPGEITGRLTLSRIHGGPAGRSHGGWVAAVLDQAMGHAIVTAGSTSLTMTLEVKYRAGTPLGVPLRVTAVCGELDRRALTVRSTLETDEEVCATATGLFLVPRENLDVVQDAVHALRTSEQVGG